MKLRFDKKSALEDFTDMIFRVSTEMAERFLNEASLGFDDKGNQDTELKSTEISTEGYIQTRVFFYANAIMQSFGTGSLMDMSSPYVRDYINSDRFNPARDKNNPYITTRPKVEYVNIYGEKAIGSGKNLGYDLEGKYPPVKPTYSIQNAEKWLQKQDNFIKRKLDTEISLFVKDMKKYFKYS